LGYVKLANIANAFKNLFFPVFGGQLILPVTAKVNKKGHLEIGNCDTVKLARDFGTPLFVVDEETIREQCRRYKNAFKTEDIRTEIIYASKAFSCIAVCQIIKEENLSLDVSSGGELYTALQAKFPASKIYLHGNNKTSDELSLALQVNVGRIVVDSFDELALLSRLAAVQNSKPNILLRVTPGIEAKTHKYVETGLLDSKFGFCIEKGVALQAVKRALTKDRLLLKGIHTHIGSQVFVLDCFERAVDILLTFASEVREEFGFSLEELNLGGGLGIRYREEDKPASIEEYARVLLEKVRKTTQKLNLEVPKVMVEPGRSIVGNAGVTLYTIGTIKEIPGLRTYVSVDGGMSDNIRPMLYNAPYIALLANKADAEPEVKVAVAGKHCESGDILIKEVELPVPEVGDILCIPATGAYGYAMASNYNRQPRPAVVLVRGGEARLIIARESYADLVRLDKPLLQN
jgi:diaminopimelate decarboxylase